jgi:hypothetical protein
MRAGFLSFFFLVPLGYTAAAYNPALAWFAFGAAACMHGLVSLGLSMYYHTGPVGAVLDMLYFTVMTLGFTWIMAGGFFRVRTAYRFIITALAGMLTFFGLAFLTRNEQGLAGLMRSQAEALASAYVASSTADAVWTSLLTPEKILESLTAAVLRGGALISILFHLFISRQAAFAVTRLFRRQHRTGELAGFHTPVNTIWVLSFCLPAIVIARLAGAEIPEIALWNLLVICGILFLAQGGGIALYTLARWPLSPFVRFMCNVLIIVVIFSPGINFLALGGLLLLGIAENWLPLRRAAKQNGSASTPGL